MGVEREPTGGEGSIVVGVHVDDAAIAVDVAIAVGAGMGAVIGRGRRDWLDLRLRLIVDGDLRSELLEPVGLRHRLLGVRIERRLPDHRLDLLPVDDKTMKLGDPGDRITRWRVLFRRHRATVDFEVHFGDGSYRNLRRNRVLALNFLYS